MSQHKFIIDEQVLREMAQLAAKNTIDTSHLEWTQVQQALTLWSLVELFKSYGMEEELPFTLAIERDPKDKEDLPNG